MTNLCGRVRGRQRMSSHLIQAAQGAVGLKLLWMSGLSNSSRKLTPGSDAVTAEASSSDTHCLSHEVQCIQPLQLVTIVFTELRGRMAQPMQSHS